MTDNRIQFRQQYFLETGDLEIKNMPMYTDWLELQLNRKAPVVDPTVCVHPFNRVISAGALHHCCDCKTNIEPEKK